MQIQHIEKLSKSILKSIETELKVHESVAHYKDCDVVKAIRNQSTGAVRAYETVLAELKRMQEEHEQMEQSML